MGAGLEAVRHGRGYHVLIRLGLVGYGLVHLVIAWIAARLAVGGAGDASSVGALEQLSTTPLGAVFLWVMAIGFFTLAVWQVIEATVGHRTGHDGRPFRRIASGGRAVVYGLLGVLAASIGAGGGGSAEQGEVTLSAALLRLGVGQLLVAGLGVGVIVFGVTQIVRGVKLTFVEDLDQQAGTLTLQLGRIGFCAKGLSMIIIGALFGWAALSDDPGKAGGLDAALGVLRDQHFGPVLLLALAGGIGCFGLYCFAWSRSARY